MKYDVNAAAKGGRHNKARRLKMQRANDSKLIAIFKGRTLSSAAAEYELRARNKGLLPAAALA